PSYFLDLHWRIALFPLKTADAIGFNSGVGAVAAPRRSARESAFFLEVLEMSKAIDRRSLIRGALASGALYGLDALFTAERTNAAAVGPNDQVKVTKVESFVLKNSWVFVKVSTDAGIVGWGEMLKDDAKACAAGALEVGRYLVGQDPNRV